MLHKAFLNEKARLKMFFEVKFIYSEKATKFCEISTVDLTVTTWDKSTVEISHKLMAFSEYMSFKKEKFKEETPKKW